MSQQEQNTYPISRLISDPVGRGTISGVATLGGLGLLQNLGRRGVIPVRKGILKMSPKQLALAGLLSGVGTGAFTSIARRAYPDTITRKLRSGGEFSDQEKNVLLKGIRTKASNRPKSMREHLFSPGTMALAGAGLYGGGILTKRPGLLPALMGAGLFGGAAMLDRYAMARGLKGRSVTGKGMTAEEEKLVKGLARARAGVS